ncbi:hypothetical protein QE152_g4851 [Popillia japonica]|uniref:Uncharacterized protein n=1 Tax=Popillia japonica TaxID=7064 RepID=A0AAW1MZD4_POPJA
MAGLIVEEEEAEQGQQQGDVMMDDHDRRVPPGDGCAAVHCSLNGMFSEDDDVFANLVVVEEQEQEQQQQDGCHAVEQAAGGDADSDGDGAVIEGTSVTRRTTPRNYACKCHKNNENRRHRPGLNVFVTVTMLANAIRTTTMRHTFLKLFRPFADLVSYCITMEELDDTLANNMQTTTDVCNKILRRRRGQDDETTTDVCNKILRRRRGQDDDKYGDDDRLENYNLQAFLEFDTAHFCWEIRGLLKRNYDNARIAVRCCRTASDRREFLHNVTSNDRFVLTNLRMDELHFNYRLSCWARRTRTSTIDYSDPFVVENRDRCRFLRRYLRDYQRQNVTLRDVIEQETDVDESVFYSEINVCYENWTLRDVIEQETDVDESVFYSEINVCYEN